MHITYHDQHFDAEVDVTAGVKGQVGITSQGLLAQMCAIQLESLEE